jgi:hypothetical protein
MGRPQLKQNLLFWGHWVPQRGQKYAHTAETQMKRANPQKKKSLKKIFLLKIILIWTTPL